MVPIYAFELKKKFSCCGLYGKPFIGAVHASINKTIKSVTRIVDNSCVTSNLFECSVNEKHMCEKQMSNISTRIAYVCPQMYGNERWKNFKTSQLVNV